MTHLLRLSSWEVRILSLISRSSSRRGQITGLVAFNRNRWPALCGCEPNQTGDKHQAWDRSKSSLPARSTNHQQAEKHFRLRNWSSAVLVSCLNVIFYFKMSAFHHILGAHSCRLEEIWSLQNPGGTWPLKSFSFIITPFISEVNQNGGWQRHRCVFERRRYLGGGGHKKLHSFLPSTASHIVQITFFYMDKILKVSPRSGGEVLDLNPKPVETFYPSPRKAARATRWALWWYYNVIYDDNVVIW